MVARGETSPNIGDNIDESPSNPDALQVCPLTARGVVAGFFGGVGSGLALTDCDSSFQRLNILSRRTAPHLVPPPSSSARAAGFPRRRMLRSSLRTCRYYMGFISRLWTYRVKIPVPIYVSRCHAPWLGMASVARMHIIGIFKDPSKTIFFDFDTLVVPAAVVPP